MFSLPGSAYLGFWRPSMLLGANPPLHTWIGDLLWYADGVRLGAPQRGLNLDCHWLVFAYTRKN